jgi:hypothetical protein
LFGFKSEVNNVLFHEKTSIYIVLEKN